MRLKKSLQQSTSCLVCSKLSDGKRQQRVPYYGPKKYEINPASYLVNEILSIPNLEANSSSSLFLCPECTTLIREVADTAFDIAELTKQLAKLKARIRKKIANTKQSLDVDVGFSQQQLDPITKFERDIRRHACLYPEPDMEERPTGGIYLNSSIWTSTATVSSSFGNLQDEIVEPEIFFPGTQVRHLPQMDPLDEDATEDHHNNNLTEDEDEKPPVFFIEPYPSPDDIESEVPDAVDDDVDINPASSSKTTIKKRTFDRETLLRNFAKGKKKPKRWSRIKKSNLSNRSIDSNSQRHLCGICGTVFQDELQLTGHKIVSHKGLEVCLELDCHKVFLTKDLEQHQKEAHPKHKCTVCICEFSTTRLRNEHILSRHKGGKIPVPTEPTDTIDKTNWIQPLDKQAIERLSTIVTRKKSSKRKENTTFLEDEIKEEDVSDFEIYNEDGLDMTNAAEELPTLPPAKKVTFQCSVCQQKFSDQNSLISHFISDHNKNVKIACHVCKKAFNTVKECGDHISKSHPTEHGPDKVNNQETTDSLLNFKCDKCPMVLASKNGLHVHQRTYHQPERKHKCRRCYMSFTNQRALLIHEITHRKKKKPPPKGKPFTCPEPGCVSYFRLSWHLRDHRIRSHNMKKPEPICKYCGKVCSDNSRLKMHIMTHTDERPVVCTICGQRFRTGGFLTIHTRAAHTKERPAKCEICGKGFYSSNKLSRHKQIHSDARNFLCSLCGKSFKTANNLYIHGWSHDPERKTKYTLYMPKAQRIALSEVKKKAKEAVAAARMAELKNSVPAPKLTEGRIAITNSVPSPKKTENRTTTAANITSEVTNTESSSPEETYLNQTVPIMPVMTPATSGIPEVLSRGDNGLQYQSL